MSYDCRAALALTECDVVNVIPVKIAACIVYAQVIVQATVCVDIEIRGCLTTLIHAVCNEVLECALRIICVDGLEVCVFIDVIIEIIDCRHLGNCVDRAVAADCRDFCRLSGLLRVFGCCVSRSVCGCLRAVCRI